jgi:hypothetical protein
MKPEVRTIVVATNAVSGAVEAFRWSRFMVYPGAGTVDMSFDRGFNNSAPVPAFPVYIEVEPGASLYFRGVGAPTNSVFIVTTEMTPLSDGFNAVVQALSRVEEAFGMVADRLFLFLKGKR